jgi:nitroimidazol reductase NimA-like FMN-containing flavoprotein (pyridoxamine 5'-phosphate oxidase superfamily)
VRRLAEKAAYDRTAIEAILDAVPLAHVGHLVEGCPVVTPTLQWREGGRIYWHGSSASRMVRAAAGAEVCVTVTALDGMVLARSGLEHSVHYRSVMVFGRAELVQDPDAKLRHLETMMEGMFPGRWAALRPATAQELKATAILSLPLDEASAKISAGFPDEPEADRSWPVWAGVIPIGNATGAAVPAPDLTPGTGLPAHVRDYRYDPR